MTAGSRARINKRLFRSQHPQAILEHAFVAHSLWPNHSLHIFAESVCAHRSLKRKGIPDGVNFYVGNAGCEVLRVARIVEFLAPGLARQVLLQKLGKLSPLRVICTGIDGYQLLSLRIEDSQALRA